MKDLLRETVSPVDALVEQMERLRVGLFGMTEQEEIEAVRRCRVADQTTARLGRR